MIKTPLIYSEENVSITISDFKMIPLLDRLVNIKNSKQLHISPFPGLRTNPVVSSNHLTTDLKIDIINDKEAIFNPVILLYAHAQLHSSRNLNEKDLWNVLYKCVELMKEEIKEKNILDGEGNLIVLPAFTLASDLLKPFFNFNIN